MMEPTEVFVETPDGGEVYVTMCQDGRTVIVDDGLEEVELSSKDGGEWTEENFNVVVESLRRGIITFDRLRWNAHEETLAGLTPEEWERYRSVV